MKINKILYVLSVMLILGSVAFFGYVSADNSNRGGEDNGKGVQAEEAHQKGSTLEVHISNKGKVNVQGAKVTSISGNTINASTSWGSVGLSWAVNVLSDTRLVRRFGGTATISEISVGDFIGFQGNLVTTSASPIVVNATKVKDWSIQKKDTTEFNKTVTFKLNDKITFSDGLSVVLKEINDSRCKEGLQCISMGEISAVFALSGSGFNPSKEIRLGTLNNKSISLGGYTFSLKDATKTNVTVRVVKN